MKIDDLGELLGYLAVAMFILAAFRYVLKWFFKTYGKWVKEHTKLHPLLLKVMDLNKKLHPWVGLAAALLVIAHFTTQFIVQGYQSPSGLISATLMVVQVGGGFAGQYVMKKPRPKWWLWVHRSITAALVLGLAIHILG
jgi:hypothetical protein